MFGKYLCFLYTEVVLFGCESLSEGLKKNLKGGILSSNANFNLCVGMEVR